MLPDLRSLLPSLLFFFFNDTATTEIYTLSLHDALPISSVATTAPHCECPITTTRRVRNRSAANSTQDRKSTRLNSSHSSISYAVFCLKKKKKKKRTKRRHSQGDRFGAGATALHCTGA